MVFVCFSSTINSALNMSLWGKSESSLHYNLLRGGHEEKLWREIFPVGRGTSHTLVCSYCMNEELIWGIDIHGLMSHVEYFGYLGILKEQDQITKNKEIWGRDKWIDLGEWAQRLRIFVSHILPVSTSEESLNISCIEWLILCILAVFLFGYCSTYTMELCTE